MRVLSLVAVLGFAAPPLLAAESVDFGRDVRPILAEHCLLCHGPDEKARKGGLRLDTRDGAIESAVVPGKPDDSELLRRVTSGDPSKVMPPAKTRTRLTTDQVAVLRRWVEQGARYDARHWAFTPPKKPPLPVVEAPARNPVDAFVRARLKREGLTPSAPAPAETLVRRLYLDLIGLPPSPQEIDAFVAAEAKGRPAAVEALVHRLLARPQYGEKWARHWFDLARYSDSNGYEKDLPREMWAYRDWVIAAFNRDLPYDQFLVEQLSGDLLPNRTQDQLVATGFLRNSMTNEEGAIVPEQFRTEEMFDRMDALGKAAFGLTLQCAQCHTHKYDPLTQSEYYGMFAYLNDTYEAQSWVYTPAQQKQIADLRVALAGVDARTRQAVPKWFDEIAAWEKTLLAADGPWTVIRPIEMASTSGLNHPTLEADGSILTQGHPTTKGDVFFVFESGVDRATGLRLEALPHDDLPFGGPGRSKYGTWAISQLVVSVQKPGGQWEKVAMNVATADFSEPEHPLEDEWEAAFDKQKKRVCGPVAFLIDGKDETAWRADRGPGRRNQASVAVVRFASPLALPVGSKLKVLLRYHHSGDDNGRHNTMLGRCRLSLTTAPTPVAAPVDYAAVLAARIPPEMRTPDERATLLAAWRTTRPELKPLADEAERIWKRWPQASTSILHLAARRPDQARPTRLLDRGGWDRPKQEIKPHTPAFLPPLPAGKEPPRLRFARWMADRSSPLAARVAVNRVWQAVWGTGLMETPEDFGTRAPRPEHPDLLDWLAVDFMEHGWSHKQLIHLILTSETYQQTSQVTPGLLEKDPRNRRLTRGPRFRADAEVVRDVALSAAGLLNTEAGGPSVFPPVPASVLEFNFFKPTYWKPPEGPQRYRRSIYLFRKRSMPDPVMSALDAPNGDFACARRVRSNTPLAALTTLNEPVFVEAARALALRVLWEGGKNDADRIDYAFRLCTSRHVTPEESDEIAALLHSRREKLADGWLNPREILTGDAGKLPALPLGTAPRDAAAWTLVARVILNLDETLTKN